MKIKYFADDGTEFATAESCRKYEADHPEFMLAERSVEEIIAILTKPRTALLPEECSLADAIEVAARRIQKARYTAGDFKRVRGSMAAESANPNFSPEPGAEMASPSAGKPDELLAPGDGQDQEAA